MTAKAHTTDTPWRALPRLGGGGPPTALAAVRKPTEPNPVTGGGGGRRPVRRVLPRSGSDHALTCTFTGSRRLVSRAGPSTRGRGRPGQPRSARAARSQGHGRHPSRREGRCRAVPRRRAGRAARPHPQPLSRRARPRTDREHRPTGDRSPMGELIRRFERYEDMILRFATDLVIHFSNNLAERDQRPVKVQQRTSGGCWRTLQGVTDFARIVGLRGGGTEGRRCSRLPHSAWLRRRTESWRFR